MNRRSPSAVSSNMSKSLKIVLAVAVVAVAGFAAVYFTVFGDDAPEELTLGTPPTSTGGAPASPVDATTVAGVWKVAPGSEAGYRVREKLAALPAQSDAVGRTPAVTGSFRLERQGNGFTATAARFEADLTKLTSDETRRDNRIRTQGLESNRFPTATFVSSAPITLPADAVTGRAVKVSAEGDLTLHGVTKRVTIPIEGRLTGGRIELAGSHRFPMSDFAIEPPNIANFVSVEPDATLEFRLVLEKDGA